MKKLFTIDDIMVCFISSLGYGFGEVIARLLGWPPLVCIGASMALGIVLELIISKIAFSEAVQRKPLNRVLVYIAILLFFLAAHYISLKCMNTSMVDYLTEELAFVVGFSIIGFVVNLVIRAWQIHKIRQRYGDGSEGYVFDVKREDIEETNRQNQPISGGYDADLAVKTRTGVYVGEKLKHSTSYCGIPYAKPPVGALRWKAPQPLPDSEAVFEALHFGASAIQVEHKGLILKHHRQSEDCLTLNICVGNAETEAKKPVLVLFHLGNFTYGGTADPLMYGVNFIADHPDTLFVSFNYRLGILGFIDFSQIPGGEACSDALNLGLLDQIAALKWIRENISAFGGDPDRITVMGFEAGADSILLLAASGHAKGLFQRAFLFNGSLETAYYTPEASKALAQRLLKETRTSTMQELMGLTTEALKDAAQKLWPSMSAPTCDGAWLPTDIYSALKENAGGIEFIFGIPSNERHVFRSFVGNENYKILISAAMDDLQKSMDAPTAKAVQAYLEKQAAASTMFQAQEELVELWIALGIYKCAVRLSEAGNTVRLMYWDLKPLTEKLGSGTVDAAAVLLGNGEAAQMYGSVLNKDLSETLQCLLHKFVAGKPLELYTNEIKGIDALDWQTFPQTLIVSDGELACEPVQDRLTEIEGLVDLACR